MTKPHAADRRNPRRTPIARLAGAALALLCASGLPGGPVPPAAAQQDSLVARIGEREVFLSDFVREWNRRTPAELPRHRDPLERRKLFLQDLVLRHALAEEALSHPKKLLPGDAATLEELRTTAIKNQLYLDEVVEPSGVDRVDLDLFVNEITRVLDLRAFVFPEERAARAWYTRLVRGTPTARLEEAAEAGGESAPRLVELGPTTREALPDSVARVLFRLLPGRVSEPVASGREWALYQVTEIRQRPASVDLADPEAILAEAKRLRANEAREAYRAQLGREIEIEYREAALDTLASRFRALGPMSRRTLAGVTEFQMFLPLPRIGEEDSALVLAESKEGPVTAAQVMRFLEDLEPYARPEISSREHLMPWVDRVAFDRLLLERAEARGLADHPRVRSEVQRRYEGYQVTMMFEDSVTAQVRLATDSLRAYFEAHRAHFDSPATAEIWMVMAGSREAADSVASAARAGADLAELARTYSVHTESAENGGRYANILRGHSDNVELEDSIFTAPIGEFAGPVQTQNGWVFFRVEDRTERKNASFEEVIDHVASDLRREREAILFDRFVERVLGRTRVETWPERLAAIVESES